MKWIHKIGSAWGRPRGRFIITVAVLAGLFLLIYRDDLLGRLLDPWVEVTAQMTACLLQVFNMEAVRTGTQIRHPGGFAYEIYYRCTAILPTMLLAVFIAASPAPVSRKAVGLAVGVPALIIVNLLRLVHLFHTGVNNPALFTMAHEVLWEIILIAAMLGLWWTWWRWAAGSNSGLPHNETATYRG